MTHHPVLTDLKPADRYQLLTAIVLLRPETGGMINEMTYQVDWQGAYPAARLYAAKYVRLEDIEQQKIPTLSEEKQI